ncbi:hypothetical protein MMA231_02481 [Asticcacaulis sp. MM231]|uniref:hypothetical protein n=1 Tax=Asticcacaulis sp. MM231 TaxID=3157666 RepID=UPI0032D5A6C7
MTKSVLSDQDFNGAARLLNLPAPVSNSEPARLSDIAGYISGTAGVGNVLTHHLPLGALSGSRQWYQDAAQIDGETGASYTQVSADGGKTITCRLSNVVWSGGAGVLVPAPPVTAYLPTVTGTLQAAWGITKMVSAYAGAAIQIKIGGVDTNLGFVGQNLDTSLLTSGTLYAIVQWYDQSGNGNHKTAPGSINQPYLYWETGSLPVVQLAEYGYFSLPALTTDPANTCIVQAAAYYWQGRPVDTINCGTANQTDFRVGCAIGGASLAMQMIVSNTAKNPPNDGLNNTKLMTTCTPCIVGVNNNGSGSTVRRDGYTYGLTANTSTTLTGGRTGWSGSGTSYGRMDFYGMVKYTAALSSGDELLVAAYMRDLYLTNSWTPSKAITVCGDSKTQSDAAAANKSLTKCLHNEYGRDRSVIVRNIGLNGTAIQFRYATFRFYYGSGGGLYVEQGAKNILVNWLGTNDVVANRTLENITTDTNNFWHPESSGNGSSLATQGFYGSVQVNIMPRKDMSAPQIAVRDSVNAAMAANTIAGISGHHANCDFYNLTTSGQPLVGFAESNPNSLSGDGIHESAVAYVIEAPYLKAAIEAVAA